MLYVSGQTLSIEGKSILYKYDRTVPLISADRDNLVSWCRLLVLVHHQLGCARDLMIWAAFLVLSQASGPFCARWWAKVVIPPARPYLGKRQRCWVPCAPNPMGVCFVLLRGLVSTTLVCFIANFNWKTAKLASNFIISDKPQTSLCQINASPSYLPDVSSNQWFHQMMRSYRYTARQFFNWTWRAVNLWLRTIWWTHWLYNMWVMDTCQGGPVVHRSQFVLRLLHCILTHYAPALTSAVICLFSMQ